MGTLRRDKYGEPASCGRTLSPEAVRWRTLAAEKRRLALRQLLLRLSKKRWPGLSPQEKATRTAMARALAKKYTNASDTTVLALLNKLAREGKVRLPPKTSSGGPNFRGKKR
ncbi:MAG: hypothetical protein NTW59_02775 [Candidatus Diapherotrites archaeon]|nr:hypothetical protein [Candidatus Diapherotrites archaeon]